MKADAWSTIVHYVETETGAYLTKKDALRYYTTIKKTKTTSYEHIKDHTGKTIWTKGKIEITNECRRKPKQGELY